jgi:hypothetical protein
MKTSIIITLAAVLLSAAHSTAQTQGRTDSGIAGGFRYHQDHTVFEELPFGEGDISYVLAYEATDQNMVLQLGCGYCPDVTGSSNAVEYALTPQANLILKDGMWRGGLGVMRTYIKDDDDTTDAWTHTYFQFLLGVEFPLFNIPLSVYAYYPFDDWSNLSEFDVEDVDFGATLRFNL